MITKSRQVLLPATASFICLLGMATASISAEWRLVVRADKAVPASTPVMTTVDVSLAEGAYILEPEKEGPRGMASCYQIQGGKRQLVALLPAMAAGSEAAFRLAPGPIKAGTGIRFVPPGTSSSPNVVIELGGKLFTTLVLTEPTKPYLYPVIGPTGQPFTRAYPMKEVEGEDHDHPHQRSLWFTHGDVNGFDFWASDPLNGNKPKFGKIRPRKTEVLTLPAEGAAVVIRMDTDWLGPDDKPVCEDQRLLTFYASSSPRLIDVDVTIKASSGPVTFGDTKEGMFGLRVPSSMNVKRKEGGKITNAEGITDTEAWGKASPWVDYTGPVDGQTVGIAIFNHPDSFRYPTTWHVRDYGLFAANPFGYSDFKFGKEGAYTIPEGQHIQFRYRVILHEKDTKSAAIAQAFQAYITPPRVQIQIR